MAVSERPIRGARLLKGGLRPGKGRGCGNRRKYQSREVKLWFSGARMQPARGQQLAP